MSKSTRNQLPQINFTLVWFSGVILLIFLVDIPVGLGLSFDVSLGCHICFHLGLELPVNSRTSKKSGFNSPDVLVTLPRMKPPEKSRLSRPRISLLDGQALLTVSNGGRLCSPKESWAAVLEEGESLMVLSQDPDSQPFQHLPL